MNEIWQPPPPKTVRGIHTRFGVPHETDIEVESGLEKAFSIPVYVCQECHEYCTDATVQFLDTKEEEVNMTDTYPVGSPTEESKDKEKEPPPPPPPA